MTLTLLCVEDEPDLLADLIEELTYSGYTAHGAASAEQALERLSAGGIDMVLCDVQLPGLSGPELHARVRMQCSAEVTPPFVYLTAFGRDALRHLGIDIGASRLIVKPIDFDALDDTIRDIAAQARVPG